MELLLWGALAIDGVILLAALVKWRAVAVASKWPSAKGRILTSDTEARKVSRIADGVDMIQADDIRNFAAIRYAFNVGERKFRGTRIHLGEDPGNVHLAETLKRYPRGSEVTVYYDPANPENCVLDRDPPTPGFLITAIGTTAAVAVGLAAMLLAANGMFEGQSLPELRWTPTSAGAVCLLALGLVLVAAWRRHRQIMRHWRTTPGTILSSDAVKLKQPDKWLSPRSTFRASTTYEYAVDGVRYVSDRIGFGEGIMSNQRIFARRDAGRFHPGMPVEVLYDPDNPASAILVKPRTGWRQLSALILIAGSLATWSPMPHAQAAAQDIQPAIEKANLYIETAKYTERAVDSWDRYLSWVDVETGPTGKERYISYGMYPIDDLSGLLEAARAAAGQEPGAPQLDAAMKRYIDAYEALFPVMNRANDYYEEELYRTDGMTEGRALHARMIPLVTVFLTEREAMLQDLRPFVRDIEQQEVTAIEAREGRSLAWQAARIMHAANRVVDVFPRTRPTPIDADTLEEKLNAIGPDTSGEEFDEIIAGVAKPADVAIDMERFGVAVEDYAGAVDLFEHFAAAKPEGLEDFKDLPRRLLTSLHTLQESLMRSEGRDFTGSGQQVGQTVQLYFSMLSASSRLSRSGLRYLQ